MLYTVLELLTHSCVYHLNVEGDDDGAIFITLYAALMKFLI